jgi:hypothetical protein
VSYKVPVSDHNLPNTLTEALDAGDIDVDPEYQREVVWTGAAFLQPCAEDIQR